MNILVCIKQVPDTEAVIKAGASGTEIDEAGVKFIINPYDEFAIEEALRIKDAKGSVSIKAICLGPDRAKEALRTAAAMGVDDVLLLKNDNKDIDGLAVAQVLADVIKNESYELILMGKESIDDGNMQVGPMMGELLGVPCISVVTKLSLDNRNVVVEREGEGGTEVLETMLPCIVTCQKGLNEPRYPSIRGVMMAKKKEIPEQAVEVPAARVKITGLTSPPIRSGGKVVGEGPEAVPELIRLLRQEAKVI